MSARADAVAHTLSRSSELRLSSDGDDLQALVGISAVQCEDTQPDAIQQDVALWLLHSVYVHEGPGIVL